MSLDWFTDTERILILVVLLLLLVSAVAIALATGKDIEILGVKIKPKRIDDDAPATRVSVVAPSSATTNPTQTVTQNPTQTVHVYTQLSSQDVQRLASAIAERVREIRSQESPPPVPSSELGPMPQGLEDLLHARLEMYRRVSSIVLDYGGAWAGASLAPLEQYLELAVDHHLIPSQLGSDIQQFLYLTGRLFSGGGTGGDDVADAQVLAAHILEELRRIRPDTST